MKATQIVRSQLPILSLRATFSLTIKICHKWHQAMRLSLKTLECKLIQIHTFMPGHSTKLNHLLLWIHGHLSLQGTLP